jgi:hypothetical protein
MASISSTKVNLELEPGHYARLLDHPMRARAMLFRGATATADPVVLTGLHTWVRVICEDARRDPMGKGLMI